MVTKSQYALELAAERELRQEHGAALNYIPRPKQKAFHLCSLRERWAFTGNRFGKTTMSVAECIWHATGVYPGWYPEEGKLPQPTRGRFVCVDFLNGIQKIILPELNKRIDPRDIEVYSKQFRTFTFKNGSTLELMSYEADLRAFGGTSRHYTTFDEHGSKEIYDECKMRLLDTNGRFWGTLTPKEGMTWEFRIAEREFERKDLAIFRGATVDNPLITREVLDDITYGLSPEEKRACLYGEAIALVDMVYKNWDRQIHLIKPEIEVIKGATIYMAIDSHPRNPTGILWLAVTKRGDWIVYRANKYGEKTIKELCAIIKDKEGKEKPIIRLLDTPTDEDVRFEGADIQLEFSHYGIHTIKAERSAFGFRVVRDRLEPVEDKLTKRELPGLFVFSDCTEFIYEIEHYVYANYARKKDEHNPKEKPKKVDDHLMDCLRYIANANPAFIKKRDMKEQEYIPRNIYTGY